MPEVDGHDETGMLATHWIGIDDVLEKYTVSNKDPENSLQYDRLWAEVGWSEAWN